MNIFNKSVSAFLCCLLAISIYIFFSDVKSHAVTYDAIFRISSQNDKDISATVQTGFTVQGKKGIITALHGVADKKIIKACKSKSAEPCFELKIDAVDFAHDIALLSSPNLKIKEGLLPAPASDNVNYEGIDVHIAGYSLSRNIVEPSWNFKIRSYTKLKDLIPVSGEYKEEYYNEMKGRKSPDIDKDVLSIEGTFLPGHSGAPVLNKENQVVGIVNGSLYTGNDIGNQISWAIPYKDINLTSGITESELNRIARIAKLPTPFSCSSFQTPNGELLTWQRPGAGKMMTWIEAIDYVEEMNRKSFMGYNDWRLPAVGELEDLAQFIKNSPGSYSDVDKLYWSSESYNEFEAKAVNLGNYPIEEGDHHKQRRQRDKNDNKIAVRLVRSL